jgi:hypothetical protein
MIDKLIFTAGGCVVMPAKRSTERGFGSDVIVDAVN